VLVGVTGFVTFLAGWGVKIASFAIVNLLDTVWEKHMDKQKKIFSEKARIELKKTTSCMPENKTPRFG
jgi:hypothetical protein